MDLRGVITVGVFFSLLSRFLIDQFLTLSATIQVIIMRMSYLIAPGAERCA